MNTALTPALSRSRRGRGGFLGLISLSAGFLVASSTFAAAPKLPEFPPLKFTLPEPERYTLPNGMTVMLLPDHDLPLIQVQLLFKAGSQYDPADKVGLAGLLGPTWTLGGSTTRRPEDIEQLLARTAASIGFSVDLESGSGSMNCRTKNFDEVFAAFVDLWRNPGFRADKFRLVRDQTMEGLRRINEDPAEQSRREFRRLIYGGAHPYARIPSPKSLENVRPADLLEWHSRFARPNTAYLAVSGDFDPAIMKTKLEQALANWPKADLTLPALPPVPAPHGDGRVYFIRRALKQTQIRMGQLGLKRHDPDEFAWLVFNEIWGGSSTSRLFTEVRTRRGLAYAVASGYSMPENQGLVVAISQTRGGQTIAAIRAMQEIQKDLSEEQITAEELRRAQDSLVNQFVQNFNTAAQIVGAYLQNAYFGYPTDYLRTYTRRIRQVSLANVQQAVRKHLDPAQTVTFVVGDPSTFEKPLSSLGKYQEVQPIDYSIVTEERR